jgi:hypothetical protein
MLRVNHPQVLRRFGYFINGNMALSSLKTAVMEKGEQRIRDHAKAFLDDANQVSHTYIECLIFPLTLLGRFFLRFERRSLPTSHGA